ncbi:hypothetical protein BLA24064_06310 [Burkholderia latens]|uniref:Uncharacterized protein n=1 Tax=Burkholderia latens TaxID=488446 RepID=A0A6P2R5V6_9BURK|nr:hypothetical protein BLA24064_06310 [Burkholderia latens]
MRGEFEMRQRDGDPAPQADAFELTVDRAGRFEPRWRRAQLRGLRECVGRHRAAPCERMRRAHQAHDAIVEQVVLPKARRARSAVVDHDVEFAVGERAFVVEAVAERMEHQLRVRCALAKQRDELRHEQHVQIVGAADPIRAHRRARVERRLLDPDEVDHAQRIAQRLDQPRAELGRHHSVAAAHQQRIAEQRAQTLERGARRRLRHVQPHGRTRHGALGEQHEQHAHQPRIEHVERARGVGRVDATAALLRCVAHAATRFRGPSFHEGARPAAAWSDAVRRPRRARCTRDERLPVARVVSVHVRRANRPRVHAARARTPPT